MRESSAAVCVPGPTISWEIGYAGPVFSDRKISIVIRLLAPGNSLISCKNSIDPQSNEFRI